MTGQLSPVRRASTKIPLTDFPLERHRPFSHSVLQLIWKSSPISRADIARHAGLSRSTVSKIVGDLLQKGMIEEVGAGPSNGGRRPIAISFQDDKFSILGVEMGAAHVAVALTNLRGRVECWRERHFAVRTDPVGTRKLIRKLCDECLEQSNLKASKLLGIGIAVPSPVDPTDPGHLSEVVLPAWKGRSGLEAIQKHYSVPLFVDNDANLGALAELWWGAGQGIKDFAYVKIGTGVGSGHVVRGEVYRGASGVAGEIGHLAIDRHGELCVCGLRGCLATLVGAQALEARSRALLSNFPESTLAHGPLTIDALEEAALDGDPLALQVAREAAENLGIAAASLLNLMNPSLVVLGGGLSQLGELLLEPLRETVRERTLVSSLSASRICTSRLGPQAIAVGAATLVLEAALADPTVFPSTTSSPALPSLRR